MNLNAPILLYKPPLYDECTISTCRHSRTLRECADVQDIGLIAEAWAKQASATLYMRRCKRSNRLSTASANRPISTAPWTM